MHPKTNLVPRYSHQDQLTPCFVTLSSWFDKSTYRFFHPKVVAPKIKPKEFQGVGERDQHAESCTNTCPFWDALVLPETVFFLQSISGFNVLEVGGMISCWNIELRFLSVLSFFAMFDQRGIVIFILSGPGCFSKVFVLSASCRPRYWPTSVGDTTWWNCQHSPKIGCKMLQIICQNRWVYLSG